MSTYQARLDAAQPRLRPDMYAIQPLVAGQPLTDDQWFEKELARLEQTLWELSATREEWERQFGIPHPGPGYTRVMEAQRDYCRRVLARFAQHHEG